MAEPELNTLNLLTMKRECLATSPLLGPHHIGMAFRCSLDSKHDGPHVANVTWLDYGDQRGTIVATWTDAPAASTEAHDDA